MFSLLFLSLHRHHHIPEHSIRTVDKIIHLALGDHPSILNHFDLPILEQHLVIPKGKPDWAIIFVDHAGVVDVAFQLRQETILLWRL